jgi:hypothetical protein
MSPDEKRFKQFEKGGGGPQADRVYMPIWTKREIIHCYAHLPFFRRHPRQLVLRRLAEWGPSPRYVLEYPHRKTQQAKLLGACTEAASQGVLKTLRSAGPTSGNNRMSDKVFHMAIASDYQDYQFVWASEYVEREVLQRQRQLRADEIDEIIREALDVPQFGIIAGRLFEKRVHDYFSGGGANMTRYHLHPPKSRTVASNLVFQPTSSQGFSNISTMGLVEPRVYYIPDSQTFPAADSFAVVEDTLLMFQTSISLEHSAKVEGLWSIEAAARKTCPGISKCVVVWVMPPPRAEAMQWRKWQNQNGTTIPEQLMPANLTTYEQWVATMPLTAATTM